MFTGKKTYSVTKGKRKISIFSLLSLIPLSKYCYLLADILLPVIYTYSVSLLWPYIISTWEAFKKNTDSRALAQPLNKNLWGVESIYHYCKKPRRWLKCAVVNDIPLSRCSFLPALSCLICLFSFFQPLKYRCSLGTIFFCFYLFFHI